MGAVVCAGGEGCDTGLSGSNVPGHQVGVLEPTTTWYSVWHMEPRACLVLSRFGGVSVWPRVPCTVCTSLPVLQTADSKAVAGLLKSAALKQTQPADVRRCRSPQRFREENAVVRFIPLS